MTTNAWFDDRLAAWLQEDSEHRVPEHLGEVLELTQPMRQRAWWSSPERWLPLDATLRLAPAPKFAWLLVVLGLVLALGVAAALVGSPPNLPPPFGLARNGPVIYSRDGDIFRFDPVSNSTTTLVTGAPNDAGPYWSRDGQTIVFLRETDDGSTLVMTARADGSDVRPVTSPLEDIGWYDWSADGRLFALISQVDSQGAITVARTDGTAPVTLELPLDVQFATFRGPDARELVFRGIDQSNGMVALYTVSVDGSNLKTITPAKAGRLGSYQQPITSPDGSHVAYTAFENAPGTSIGTLFVHVLDLASERDVVIPAPLDGDGAPYAQGYAAFSPDGKTLLMQRLVENDGLEWVVAPADGSALPRQIGPTMNKTAQQGSPFWEFTPDGTAVVIADMEQQVVLVFPLDGGEPTTLPFDGENLPSTQRQAP